MSKKRRKLDPILGGLMMAIRETFKGTGVKTTWSTPHGIKVKPVLPDAKEQRESCLARPPALTIYKYKGQYVYTLEIYTPNRTLDPNDPALIPRVLNVVRAFNTLAQYPSPEEQP